MKIRNGFVTNSSSTSFIISIKKSFTKESFLEAIGATGESAINKIFEDLFNAIDENKQDLTEIIENDGSGNEIEAFLKKDGYDDKTITTVKRLLSEGRTVFYGQLHSDGSSAAEIYFCCDSFLLCEEDIYFNGSIGGW